MIMSQHIECTFPAIFELLGSNIAGNVQWLNLALNFKWKKN